MSLDVESKWELSRVRKKPKNFDPGVQFLGRAKDFEKLKLREKRIRKDWRQKNIEFRELVTRSSKGTKNSDRFSAIEELNQLENPLLIVSKSFIENAGLGLVVNWKFPQIPEAFKIPFVGLEIVDFYSWEPSSWVIGNVDTELISTNGNYAKYREYLRRNKGKPKTVWRPRIQRTRSEQITIPCANFINHTMPAETPDHIAIVRSTGQDLRIANCDLVAASNKKHIPYVESKKGMLKPGWELLFSYGDGFRGEQKLRAEQEKDKREYSQILKRNLPNSSSGDEIPITEPSHYKVKVLEEVNGLKDLSQELRLQDFRDCPSELAIAPLLSQEEYIGLLKQSDSNKATSSHGCSIPVASRRANPIQVSRANQRKRTFSERGQEEYE